MYGINMVLMLPIRSALSPQCIIISSFNSLGIQFFSYFYCQILPNSFSAGHRNASVPSPCHYYSCKHKYFIFFYFEGQREVMMCMVTLFITHTMAFDRSFVEICLREFQMPKREHINIELFLLLSSPFSIHSTY